MLRTCIYFYGFWFYVLLRTLLILRTFTYFYVRLRWCCLRTFINSDVLLLNFGFIHFYALLRIFKYFYVVVRTFTYFYVLLRVRAFGFTYFYILLRAFTYVLRTFSCVCTKDLLCIHKRISCTTLLCMLWAREPRGQGPKRAQPGPGTML